jgi:hypothetical protein
MASPVLCERAREGSVSRRWRSEAGQVVPLVAVLVLAAGGGMIALGRVGQAAVERAHARSAADAAALAGAAEGEGAAQDLAAANGARLLSYEEDGPEAEVRVAVGRAEASARARRDFDVGGLGGGGGAGPGGLAPAMQAALARAEQLLGRPVPVTSGYRSPAHQAELYRRRATNPYPVAPPGTSMHERGLAIDVPSSFVPGLLRVSAQAGLCHPYPESDPVHFEVCRGR